MRKTLAQLRVIVCALAVLMLGVVVIGGSPATAVADKTCDAPEYVKIDSASGTATPEFGTLSWSGTTIDYTVEDGYVVGLCIKAAEPTFESDPIVGPATGSFSTTDKHEISHIGYWFLEAPAPEEVTETHEDCDLSAYGNFGAGKITRTGLRSYVWDAASTSWVLEPDSGIEWGAWQFTPYTDDEYFAECAGDRPPPERVVDTDEGCDMSSYGSGFGAGSVERIGLREYVWSAQTRQWVLEPVSGIEWGAWSFTPFTDEEYFEECAPDQPAPETRRVPDSEESCELAGVTSWVDVYTTPYVWDAAEREWVLGQETGPVRSDVTFTAYTDEEYQEACGGDQPTPETRQVAGSEESCELGGVTSWIDVYTTPYVWDLTEREWVLGSETGPVRTGEVFTEYTDEEYFEECASDQPKALLRKVAGAQASCEIKGTRTWVDVYTTEFVWDAETRDWVLGVETGPVRTAETFTPYGELPDECVDDKGKDPEDKDPKDKDPKDVEVRGAQQTAAVPTVVDAGSGATDAPGPRSPNGLTLIALGGGLLMIGFAGSRRRTTARR